MRIIVATLTGKRIVIDDIKREDNFDLLSDILYEKEGIPENHQRFIFAGKEIEKCRRFVDYNVQNESLIHMVLRTGGRKAEFPSISMVAHGGITIDPKFEYTHDCNELPYKESYGSVYKSTRPLFFMKPLKITFDLSKLCVARPCYPGLSKTKGAGFLLDRFATGEYRNKIFGRIIIYELVNGKMFTDSYAKMVRNRKEVLDVPLDYIDPSKLKDGRNYYCNNNNDNNRNLQKRAVNYRFTKFFFPKGKKRWKRNAMYMCVLCNNEGGFRWRFQTCSSDYRENEDELERTSFVMNRCILFNGDDEDIKEKYSTKIVLSNKSISHFSLMRK